MHSEDSGFSTAPSNSRFCKSVGSPLGKFGGEYGGFLSLASNWKERHTQHTKQQQYIITDLAGQDPAHFTRNEHDTPSRHFYTRQHGNIHMEKGRGLWQKACTNIRESRSAYFFTTFSDPAFSPTAAHEATIFLAEPDVHSTNHHERLSNNYVHVHEFDIIWTLYNCGTFRNRILRLLCSAILLLVRRLSTRCGGAQNG